MKIDVLRPASYCKGVVNAINIVKKARKDYPEKNIYVLGMLVHNKEVISQLENLNVVTLNREKYKQEIDKIDSNSILIFTAHGHDKKIEDYAKKKNLKIIDATCEHVASNIILIKKKLDEGYDVLYVGQKGHPETEAVLSISNRIYLVDVNQPNNYYKTTKNKVFAVNQTTLNYLKVMKIYENLKKEFPSLEIMNEICNTTRKRQEALLNLSSDVDCILVVGDKKSNNTNKLFEIAKNAYPNVDSYFIENIDDLQKLPIHKKNHIAISSGASTPPETVNMIVKYLNDTVR